MEIREVQDELSWCICSTGLRSVISHFSQKEIKSPQRIREPDAGLACR